MAKGRQVWMGMCVAIVLTAHVPAVTLQRDARLPSNPPMREVTRLSSAPGRIVVHRVDAGLPYESVGRKVVYRYDVGPYGKTEVSIVAVQSERRGTYVSVEQDIYVDVRGNLVGAKVNRNGAIVWCRNLIDVARRYATLDDALRDFETQTRVAAVEGACRVSDSTPTIVVTDLRPAFSPWSFTNGKYSSESARDLRATVIDSSSGQLNLRLENVASAFVGHVWIDVESKEVVRAIEGGTQVFPR